MIIWDSILWFLKLFSLMVSLKLLFLLFRKYSKYIRKLWQYKLEHFKESNDLTKLDRFHVPVSHYRLNMFMHLAHLPDNLAQLNNQCHWIQFPIYIFTRGAWHLPDFFFPPLEQLLSGVSFGFGRLPVAAAVWTCLTFHRQSNLDAPISRPLHEDQTIVRFAAKALPPPPSISWISAPSAIIQCLIIRGHRWHEWHKSY